MKTLVTIAAVAVLATAATSAQNAKPQGAFQPTDPRACERQMAQAMRNVSMGAFESTQVGRKPRTEKGSDATQFTGATRQQAMMSYLGCISDFQTPQLRGRNQAPAVPTVQPSAGGSK